MKKKIFLAALSGLLLTAGLVAGVDKQIQRQYVDQYKNRALYLKVPVHGFRQAVLVSSEPALDYSTASQPLAFKVGDQVRVTDVDFKDDEVRFKLASIDLSREAELIFRFPREMDDAFAQRAEFDKALDYALTIGLSYKDIDTAKEDFIKDQFDQLIDRFASTTGTTSQFVIQTISEKNPEFQRLRKSLAAERTRAEGLESRVEAAESKARAAESSIGKLRRDLQKAEADADSLNEERSDLLSQKNDLAEEVEKQREEIRKWRDKNTEYERQVNQLIQNLEIKSGSEAELGSRVQSLGAMIDSLKTERGDLSSKLTETGRLVQELQKSKEELTGKLDASEKEKARLAGNLRELTSDKNSLQSRYLQTKTRKEALETVRELEAGLRLGAFQQGDDEALRAELRLLGQPVGILELRPPGAAGPESALFFEALSPDTVKFSDDQRRLYAALGEKLRMQAAWEPGSDVVQASLVDGEALQSVAPRQKGQWRWTFQGRPENDEPAVLRISLKDANDETVQIADRPFKLSQGGWLRSAFSGWGLAVAFLTGSALAGVLGVAVGRSLGGSSKPRQSAPLRTSTEKRL